MMSGRADDALFSSTRPSLCRVGASDFHADASRTHSADQRAGRKILALMEELDGLSAEDLGLCSDRRPAAAAPGWAVLHKAVIALVMGSLMSAAGAVLLLLRSTGVAGASPSLASACLSVGLMFVALGLVWLPVLKEAHRRRRLSQGLD